MTSAHPQTVLSARGIVVGYGKGDPILDGLSLDVLPGELTVIVGPNACGKSTLLRALARVLRVRGGVVELDGRAVATMNQKALARRLGLLAQSSRAPADILVEELVARGRYPHQPPLRQWSERDEHAVERAMEDAGVSSLVGRRVGELSGGQRQRVWIAMALAQETDILLLDEPTTYLDLNHQLEVLRVAQRLHRGGTTVVAVLHDLHLAFRYATHVVFMKDGSIVAQGRPSQVVNPDVINRVFGVPCRIIDDPVTSTPIVIPTS